MVVKSTYDLPIHLHEQMKINTKNCMIMLTDLLGALLGCNVLNLIHEQEGLQTLVILIFKSGKKSLPNNYRPSSLLPTH